jgi:hypothetical protein
MVGKTILPGSRAAQERICHPRRNPTAPQEKPLGFMAKNAVMLTKNQDKKRLFCFFTFFRLIFLV